MRDLDPDYAAHIATGATTLCWCWRIKRPDGAELGFTDHDRPLSFAGMTFEPADGLEGGAIASRLGPGVATSEVLGILSSEAIAEEDIVDGRFDGAEVTTWRVNWRDPAVRDRQRVDTIGEIAREDGVFRAELRSGEQAMNIPRGRRYQSLCDAELGDGRCGVDLETAQMRAVCTVDAIVGQTVLSVGDLGGFEPAWFSHGTAVWASGRRAGLTDRIVSHAVSGGDHLIGFSEAVGNRVAPGDGLTVYAGCDKTHATCRARFSNIVNFRGFPHIPGNDFLLRYPQPGDDLNGGPLVR